MTRPTKYALPVSLLALLISIAPIQSDASDTTRPYFKAVNPNSVDLLRDFPALPLTEMIDERLGVYGGDNASSTGAFISIRSIYGWGFSESALDDTGQTYTADFPPCFSEKQSDCISRVFVTKEDGSQDDALPVKDLPPLAKYYGQSLPPSFQTFAADETRNRPAGGILWMWKFNSFQHRGGSLIIPSVFFEGHADTIKPEVFQSPIVRIGMYPVSVGDLETCVTDEKGICIGYKSAVGVVKGLEKGSVFAEKLNGQEKLGLQFRTSVPWTRWSTSTITQLNFRHWMSGKDYVYEIVGKPGVVPGVAKTIPITTQNVEVIKEIASGNFNCPKDSTLLSQCWAGIFVGGKDGAGSGSRTYDLLDKLEPLTDGKSSVAIQHWLIQTNLNSGEYSNLSCVKANVLNQPAGISSSNATLAQDTPPIWNPSTQSFTYRVGAFRKLPNGDTFKGHYSLLIPSKIAKCLWPGSLTNAKLQLNVVNSDGTEEVITSTTGIGPEWFTFQAAGFHFSSPKLVAKVVTQTSTTPKIQTITCVKGKVTKKVSGLTPKCPSGYKKK